MTHVQFGFCVPIFAWPGVQFFRTPNYSTLDAQATLQIARRADELGYDSLWVADHLMLGKDEAILEGWTVLAALAGSTRNAKLGVIHQADLFRPPAITAKMAATIDQISGGRLIHFIDSGTQRREQLAYGLDWNDDPNVRFARLRENIEIALALWTSDQPVSYSGTYYHVQDALCQPGPIQQPHPPIWLGEAHPMTLDICAQYGQGWNTTPVSLAELRKRLAALHTACATIGRDFNTIEKSLEIQVLIAPDHAALREKVSSILQKAPANQVPDAEATAFVAGQTDELPRSMAETWLAGTPDEVADRIRAYIAAGISHFMLWFVDAPDENGLRLFAEQVRPLFR